MAGTLHHPGGRDEVESFGVAVVKAVITVALVAAIVAAALGGATYVLSRAFVAALD